MIDIYIKWPVWDLFSEEEQQAVLKKLMDVTAGPDDVTFVIGKADPLDPHSR